MLSAAAAVTSSTAAAQSNLRNADVQERAAGDLARTVGALAKEPGPLWIGFSVPAHDPEFSACCHGDAGQPACCGRCRIEDTRGDHSMIGRSDEPPRRVPLETNPGLVVLLRTAGGRIERVKAFSHDCEIDAGGRRVYWLTGVQPVASVNLLKTVIEANPDDRAGRRTTHGALAALAAHGAAEASSALVALAKLDANSRVRADALFWLAQRAGRNAATTITDAIENDPDTKVKERAVFALSQLPREEGVPKLIEVARSHRNLKVRQQAMFWLGQSRDPRALQFFEEVLLK
jgi:hypothetical protein